MDMNNDTNANNRRLFSDSRVATMKQLPTIALVAAASALCVAAETANQKAAKATTACGELLFLTEAAKKMTGQTVHNFGAVTQLTREQQVYALAACHAATDSQKLKFVLLEAIAATRKARALQATKEAAETEPRSAQQLAARQAELKVLIHNTVGQAAYTKAATYGTAKAGIFSVNADICVVHYENTPTDDLKCLTTIQQAADIKAAAADIMQVTEMKMQPTSAFATLKLKLTLAAAGTLGTGGHSLTESKGCTSNSQAAGAIGTVNAGFALHSVEAQDNANGAETIAIDHTGRTAGACLQPPAKGTDDGPIVETKAVAKAICELKNLQRTSMTSTYGETMKNLADDKDAQEIAEMLQTGEIKAETNGENKKQMVQNILGTSDKTIYDELIQPLERIKPAYKVSGTANSENLKTLGETDSYAAALAFCTSEAVRGVATSQSRAATTTDSAQPEDCKEKTDKNQCNNKPGCKYNEKDSKCEEDPAKTTTTPATTNTTTNNSYVINKTPLWLAVLLP
ncbi:Variant Surface Glycoprotein [Trypanosoma brucei equiperdum]|uniref:Variant Surface Glycoprotein n=1 Tax=Trypanosoma brucei equiperdum TaxID=630700 RepID=A0A3L6L866_9TRYP|nr:Variant Surface Glycoprotein [Trypanosoma brucei equiperdum]